MRTGGTRSPITAVRFWDPRRIRPPLWILFHALLTYPWRRSSTRGTQNESGTGLRPEFQQKLRDYFCLPEVFWGVQYYMLLSGAELAILQGFLSLADRLDGTITVKSRLPRRAERK